MHEELHNKLACEYPKQRVQPHYRSMYEEHKMRILCTWSIVRPTCQMYVHMKARHAWLYMHVSISSSTPVLIICQFDSCIWCRWKAIELVQKKYQSSKVCVYVKLIELTNQFFLQGVCIHGFPRKRCNQGVWDGLCRQGVCDGFCHAILVHLLVHLLRTKRQLHLNIDQQHINAINIDLIIRAIF